MIKPLSLTPSQIATTDQLAVRAADITRAVTALKALEKIPDPVVRYLVDQIADAVHQWANAQTKEIESLCVVDRHDDLTLVLDPKVTTRSYGGDCLRIGKATDTELMVPLAQPYHVRLVASDDGAWVAVADNNEWALNGKTIDWRTEVPVVPGDVIAIGYTRITLTAPPSSTSQG